MNFPIWPTFKGNRDIKFGLDRVLQLLHRVGNPHKKLPPTIHIAGTNGKGSTLAYIESVLSKKHKVHKYISPHLVRFNERIILAGKEVTDDFLNEILEECRNASYISPKIDVTFFEGITVAAFLAFSRVKADFLLLETGMGGRLDATNVVENPIATIISPISLDHINFLGDNIKDIAFEKAGIIKKNVPTIIARQDDIALKTIIRQCQRKESIFYVFNKDWRVEKKENKMFFSIFDTEIELPLPNLSGKHQIENASTALATLMIQREIEVNKNDFKAISKTKWSGRIEKISQGKIVNKLGKNYQLFIDGSHNASSALALNNWILEEKISRLKKGQKKEKIYLIFGMLKDKNIVDYIKYLAGSIDFIVALEIKNEPASRSAFKIAKYANKCKIRAVDAENFKQAIQYIKAIHEENPNSSKKTNIIPNIIPKNNPAKIIICGSLYLVGQFLQEN